MGPVATLAMKKAHKKYTRSSKIIAKNQKLVKIDHSNIGWAVVAQSTLQANWLKIPMMTRARR